MAEIMTLPTRTDPRGSLTVLEKILPFDVKRVYWMYDLSGEPRGGHRHKVTRQALVCLKGECEVVFRKNGKEEKVLINQPNQCLMLEPEDWHLLTKLSHESVLLVMASHNYDPNDYVLEPL